MVFSYTFPQPEKNEETCPGTSLLQLEQKSKDPAIVSEDEDVEVIYMSEPKKPAIGVIAVNDQLLLTQILNAPISGDKSTLPYFRGLTSTSEEGNNRPENSPEILASSQYVVKTTKGEKNTITNI